LGTLVPSGRGARASRDDSDERGPWRSAARSGPCRQGAGGTAAVRPDVVLGTRFRRRWPSGRAAAPARLLVDEGALSGGKRFSLRGPMPPPVAFPSTALSSHH